MRVWQFKHTSVNEDFKDRYSTNVEVICQLSCSDIQHWTVSEKVSIIAYNYRMTVWKIF